ncbi:MAG: hypothetical protein JXQ27_11310 [Acidobacteria bacterium]|nr:hypothetical protein [Acidobacteriota bacterium]
MNHTKHLQYLFMFGFVLVLALAGCQKNETQPVVTEESAAVSEAEAAQAAVAAEAEAAELQAQIEAQEQKLAELQKELDRQKENARLQRELQQQRQEMESLKQKMVQQQAQLQAAEEEKRQQVQQETLQEQEESRRQAEEAEALAIEQQRQETLRQEREKATVVVPANTELVIMIQNTLSTLQNTPGQEFEAFLEQPVTVDGEVVVPVNARVVGKILESRPSGKVSGKAFMAIRLDAIEVNKSMVPIMTNTLQFEAQGSGKRDAAIIGGGTGVGALIGGLIGGKKGAAIGAVIGAGGGTAAVLNTAGKEVEFPPETRFQFSMRDAITLQRK